MHFHFSRVCNEDNSDFISKAKGKWLGLVIYTINLNFTIAHEKAVTLKILC